RSPSRRPSPPAPRGTQTPPRGPRSPSGVAEDRLRLEEFVERMVAPFAPVARLLIAPERRHEVELCRVQIHLPRPKPHRHLPRMVRVRRMDVSGQPVWRVVGDLDRLLLVLIADDRHHRPEYLLARDVHAVVDVAEHGGPHIIALVEPLRPPRAARDQSGALSDAPLNEPLDLR